MPVEPPNRRVSDVVHDRLRASILDGELAPGDPVPSERVLALDLGVNRHAVREALKRLEQAGLVRITQGGPTRVLDWRDHGGMDLLLDLVRGGTVVPADVVRSVLEVRQLIGVDAARRCVANADAEERERIAGLAEDVAAVVGGDVDLVTGRYEQLWHAVVAGSGNLAYRLMLNSLVDAVAAFPGVRQALVPSDAERLRRLAAALRDGDAEAAASVVDAQLGGDVEALG
ncbi:MAG: FadR family transcriptional regulator [Patulibacter sp.]|nr:FadR family transcriptional regulator [Patulibacter sp.]